MSFTITCAAFCHPKRLLGGFPQRWPTATSEDSMGRITLPFFSLVLRFWSFTQRCPCTDEVGSLAFGGMGLPLISCIFFLSALWSCQRSTSISPGLPHPHSALHQQHECFLVFLCASTTHLPLPAPVSPLPSPGERPAHHTPPPSPFYAWKGPRPHPLLPVLLCFQAISGENDNILGMGRSSWDRALLSFEEKGSGVPCVPSTPWEGKRDWWGPDLQQRGEPLTPPIPPARTGTAPSPSHWEDFLLSSPRFQPQVGAKCGGGQQEQPLSLASLHRGVGHSGSAGGTPSSSLFPYAHFSCLLCLVSWMPGLPRAKWDTGDLHVTPVPLRTSPRLELEAAGRIYQPMGHSTNQLELACPHHPFQLPHKVRASFACIIILPACTFFA